MQNPQYDPKRKLPPERSGGPRGDAALAEAALAYIAHVDAGRIGNPPPPNPQAIAIREHNEALWRKLRFG